MPPNKAKALMLAKRQLSELVCDAINLEGINYTLPEVQTLLDGITVGGYKLSDQQIVLNQSNAWQEIFALVKNDQFAVTAEIACTLHGIAAQEDALEWGQFRSGGVMIAGTEYMPPSAGELSELFTRMIEEAEQVADVYDRAIFYFLTMARC